MRGLRLVLSPAEAGAASTEINRQLLEHPSYRAATRLASYIAIGGETDTRPLIDHAWRAGKQIYLPVIGDHYSLMFAPYSPDIPMINNRYHIPEPAHSSADLLHASDLDIVITPLLAFDSDCRRLGSGAGYYDRAFAKIRGGRPLKIGVAYDFQRVERIDAQPWDIPMDLIITEKKLYTHPVTAGKSE